MASGSGATDLRKEDPEVSGFLFGYYESITCGIWPLVTRTSGIPAEEQGGTYAGWTTSWNAWMNTGLQFRHPGRGYFRSTRSHRPTWSFRFSWYAGFLRKRGGDQVKSAQSQAA